MADEPKPEPKSGDSAAVSPAPTDVAGAKPDAPNPNSKIQAEPLSDGTTPTILKTGESHRQVAKGKAGLTNIYRKADVMTTLITFGAAVVAGVLLVGGYYFFTKSQSKTPTATPKVTTLDKADLDKLNQFFEGNSAGSSAEVLTISSSSLFKNRVAMGSDLKVIGSLDVGGTTSLGDLRVDKTSTLGVVNTRGQLTVNGPLTVQSPALFNAGGSFKGNLSATGNGSFGGSVSAASITVQTISVSGSLNVNGHFAVGGGVAPTAAPGGAAGPGASAHVIGNDTAGTISISTGSVPNNSNTGGELVKLTFHNAFPTTPTVIITPNGRSAALLDPYIIKSASFFFIAGSVDASSSTNYSFDYWVVE